MAATATHRLHSASSLRASRQCPATATSQQQQQQALHGWQLYGVDGDQDIQDICALSLRLVDIQRQQKRTAIRVAKCCVLSHCSMELAFACRRVQAKWLHSCLATSCVCCLTALSNLPLLAGGECRQSGHTHVKRRTEGVSQSLSLSLKYHLP